MGLFQLLLFLIIIICSTVLYGQDIQFYGGGSIDSLKMKTGWFLESPTRQFLDLSGKWEYKIGIDGTWTSLMIPNCYDVQQLIVFRKKIELDSTFVNKQFKLVSYGINYRCTIKINDRFMGTHVGGGASFIIEVEKNLLRVDQENWLEIVVDNRLHPSHTIPGNHQMGGWKNYGGIYREIFLIAVPPQNIDNIEVTYRLNNEYSEAELDIEALIINLDPISQDKNETNNYQFFVQIQDENGIIVAQNKPQPIDFDKDNNKKISTSLTIRNPNLWDIYEGNRYSIKLFLEKNKNVIDVKQIYIGIREFKIQAGNFYLNGKRIKIKGVIRYEDSPFSGILMTYQQMKDDIIKIRDLGANLIRTGHVPTHPYFIDLADRYGLMILEEIPVWKVPSKIMSEPRYIETAQNYFTDMVLRDRHHPSIIAWGIGSDFDSSEETSIEFVKKMKELSIQLDDRPIYFGSLMYRDHVIEWVDIAAINLHENRIEAFEKRLSDLIKQYPDKPVIVTSFGVEISPGFKGGYNNPRSLQHQAWYLLNRFRSIQNLTDIDGGIINAFADWESQIPLLSAGNEQDAYLHSSGLLTRQRDERPAFKVIKAVFHGDNIPPIPPGNFIPSNPIIYTIFGLISLLLFILFYRQDRRFSSNIQRSLIRSHGFFVDIRDQRLLAVWQTFFIGIFISVSIGLIVSGLFYHLRYNAVFDTIMTHIIRNPSTKLWFIHIIWSPIKSLVFFSFLFFVLIFVVSLFIKIGSLFYKEYFSFFQSVTLSYWVASPFLFLLPISVIYYRAIQIQPVLNLSIWMFCFFIIWYILRTFKSMRVAYNTTFSRMLITFLIIGGIVIGSFILYFENTRATIEYAQFIINIVNNS